jgi:hypothetical protein
VHARGRDLVLELALHSIADALVRCVQVVEAVERVDDGPEYHRGIDGGDGEVGLLLLEKLPGCLLGEGLTCSVAEHGVLGRLLGGNGVPVGL